MKYDNNYSAYISAHKLLLHTKTAIFDIESSGPLETHRQQLHLLVCTSCSATERTLNHYRWKVCLAPSFAQFLSDFHTRLLYPVSRLKLRGSMAVKRRRALMEEDLNEASKKRLRFQTVQTGKRPRDEAAEEAEAEVAAAYKRLAISPPRREKPEVSPYSEANSRLRECHFLREHRRLQADAAEVRHQQDAMAAASLEEQQRLREHRRDMHRLIEAQIVEQRNRQNREMQ